LMRPKPTSIQFKVTCALARECHPSHEVLTAIYGGLGFVLVGELGGSGSQPQPESKRKSSCIKVRHTCGGTGAVPGRQSHEKAVRRSARTAFLFRPIGHTLHTEVNGGGGLRTHIRTVPVASAPVRHFLDAAPACPRAGAVCFSLSERLGHPIHRQMLAVLDLDPVLLPAAAKSSMDIAATGWASRYTRYPFVEQRKEPET